MYVYIDVLIIVNFIIDFIILSIESIYLKIKVNIKRLLLASLFGEFSLTLFFMNISAMSALIFKFIISIIMIKIAFNSTCVRKILFFYIISIMLGGIIYFIKDNLNFKLYYIYVLALLILYFIFKIIKNNNKKISLKHNLRIIFNDSQYDLDGFIDTGNILKDPYLKRNIIIVSNDVINENKNILVPCKTVNGSSFIRCCKPLKVYIDGVLFNNLLVGEGLFKENYALLPGDLEIGG